MKYQCIFNFLMSLSLTFSIFGSFSRWGLLMARRLNDNVGHCWLLKCHCGSQRGIFSSPELGIWPPRRVKHHDLHLGCDANEIWESTEDGFGFGSAAMWW